MKISDDIGSIWQDISSYKAEDEKYSFYMKLAEWKFVGRYKHWYEVDYKNVLDVFLDEIEK